MKKSIFLSFLFVFLIATLTSADSWQNYGTLPSGNVENSDTVLINDTSDTSMNAAGTIKQWSWQAMIADIISALANTYEEETHATEHAVGGTDTVFPADPNADRYLKWNDTGGAIEWAEVAGGGGGDNITEGDSNVEVIDAGSGELHFDVDAEKQGGWTDGVFGFVTGTIFRPLTTTSAHYLEWQVYDNDDTTWRTAFKFINGNTPTVELGDGVSLSNFGGLTLTGNEGMDDGSADGNKVTGFSAGANTQKWHPVKQVADGKFDPADANAAGMFPIDGFAVECSDGTWPCNDTDGLVYMTWGIIYDTGFAWDTRGQELYLSETPNDTDCADDDCYGFTDTKPADTGDAIQVIAKVRTSNEIEVFSNRSFQTVE